MNLGCRLARAAFVEQIDDPPSEVVDAGDGGIEYQVRILGRLVGRVHTGHAGQLAAARTRVEAFGVTLFALSQRRSDIDLDEGQLGGFVEGAGDFTVRLQW